MEGTVVVDGESVALAALGMGEWWELTPTGMRFFGHADDITWDQTVQLGAFLALRLSRAEGSIKQVKLAIGDFMRFGRFKWGEKYAQLQEFFPTIPPASLANMQWVAGHVTETSRRREVDFEILSSVAGLDPVDQDLIVAAAETDNLNREEVRDLVALRKHPPDPEPTAHNRAALARDLARAVEVIEKAARTYTPGPTWLYILGRVVATLRALVALAKEERDGS